MPVISPASLFILPSQDTMVSHGINLANRNRVIWALWHYPGLERLVICLASQPVLEDATSGEHDIG